MTMFGLYLNILALSVSVSTFVVVAVAALQGHAVTRHDLIVPIAIQVLLASLVFILRELVRRYEARVAGRVFIYRTGTQLADFKAALLHHRQGFSKGFRTWSS
jgi:hypothetical protein